MIRITGQVVAVREGAATIKLSNGAVIDTFTTHPLLFGEIIKVVYNTNTHTILYIIPEGGSEVDFDQVEIDYDEICDETFYED